MRATGVIAGWVRAPGPEPYAGKTMGVTPRRASPRPERLWLAQERKAAIKAEDERLQQLVRSPDLAAEEKAGLSSAARLIWAIERDTAEAHELLEKSRAEPLSAADCRKLWSLVRSRQPGMVQLQSEMNAALRVVKQRWGACPDGTLILDKVQRRASDVHEYWCRMGLGWLGAARRIDTTLPLNLGLRVVVDDRVVPGRVVGAHFPTEYPLDEGHALSPSAEYPHAHDLALTGLSNARNETLFVGVRHGILHADDCRAEVLRLLNDNELRAMIFNIGAAGLLLKPDVETCESFYCKVFGYLRSRKLESELAEVFQMDICNYMQVEILSAALLADPEKLHMADRGEPVTLRLASIALLTPDDIVSWSTQYTYFNLERDRGVPVRLEVREPDVAKRVVPARVPIRQFALAMEGTLNQGIHRINRESAEQLLGRLNSTILGGDIKRSVEEMRSSAGLLRGVLPDLEAQFARARSRAGATDPAAIVAGQSLARVEQEAAYLDRTARSLLQAGRQLKTQWMRRGDWPAGKAAQGTGALLALAGFLMGEIPLMSCARGRDFTRRLDVEVKLLAAAADADDGRLPLVDKDMACWNSARSAFTPPVPSAPAPAEPEAP